MDAPFDTVLRTARLVLRPFTMGDVEDVLAYADDPEWSRFLPSAVPCPYTLEDAKRYVSDQIGVLDHHPFALEHQGRVVGSVDLRPDRLQCMAELGWSLARAHWGRGLMTEAVREVIRHGFEDLGLVRIYARSDARNRASWRVMERVGMVREGCLRQHGVDRFGVRFDELWYGLLRDDGPRVVAP